MRDVVDVAHLMGPMWSVAGRTVVVPAGDEPARFLLAEVAALVEAPGPWSVRVVDGASVVDLVLGIDGSVTAEASAKATTPESEASVQKAAKRPNQRGGRSSSGSLAGVGGWFGQWWWVIAIGLAIAAIVIVGVLFIGSQLAGGAAANTDVPTTVSVARVAAGLTGVSGGRT